MTLTSATPINIPMISSLRHAYLIMAHNQFEVLQRLIDRLDDPRNDIYVHIDRKVRQLPTLHARHSGLHVLSDRVSVVWGDVTQIKAEYVLFDAALAGGDYEYFHLISGIHYPALSQDAIHAFFAMHSGVSFFSPLHFGKTEIQDKLGRYHFFLVHLLSPNRMLFKLSHQLWRAASKTQRVLGIHRDTSWVHAKASNWCSLTPDAVRAVMARRREMEHRFRHTFCGDEFLVPTILEDAGLPYKCTDRILYVEFTPYTPKVLTKDDFAAITHSGCLFARKVVYPESQELMELLDCNIKETNKI